MGFWPSPYRRECFGISVFHGIIFGLLTALIYILIRLRRLFRPRRKSDPEPLPWRLGFEGISHSVLIFVRRLERGKRQSFYTAAQDRISKSLLLFEGQIRSRSILHNSCKFMEEICGFDAVAFSFVSFRLRYDLSVFCFDVKIINASPVSFENFNHGMLLLS